MQKELNPDLFGDMALGQSRLVQKSAPGSGAPKDWSLAMEMDKKIVDLRGQIQGVAEQLKHFGKQVQDAFRGQQQAIETVREDMQRLKQSHREFSDEAAMIRDKNQNQVVEGRQIEAKVEQMLERHQSVLRNFEVRVNQLQRIIQEKDNQLLSMQSTLIEAKAEVARLKRL